jgi:hypothetical protein
MGADQHLSEQREVCLQRPTAPNRNRSKRSLAQMTDPVSVVFVVDDDVSVREAQLRQSRRRRRQWCRAILLTRFDAHPMPSSRQWNGRSPTQLPERHI